MSENKYKSDGVFSKHAYLYAFKKDAIKKKRSIEKNAKWY